MELKNVYDEAVRILLNICHPKHVQTLQHIRLQLEDLALGHLNDLCPVEIDGCDLTGFKTISTRSSEGVRELMTFINGARQFPKRYLSEKFLDGNPAYGTLVLSCFYKTLQHAINIL